MTSRVYIVNRGAHDYTDAERFGDLVFCTEGSLNKQDISQMYRELLAALEDSVPEDFLVLTSLNSLCSIACAMFAARHHRLNLLIYSNGRYVPTTLDLHNWIEGYNSANSAA